MKVVKQTKIICTILGGIGIASIHIAMVLFCGEESIYENPEVLFSSLVCGAYGSLLILFSIIAGVVAEKIDKINEREKP